MIGKSILHYNILEKLGEGGMGVVYLAEDTKLDRQVAIKFLPRHIAKNSDERKRFEIEAKAAAALNHPNIATIHAIEEADDEIFLVMEYIEGRELKEIVRAKQFSDKSTIGSQINEDVASSIQIAIQIARGLQAAHEKGIIHRDIKSTNIMVTDKGDIKIMDFGLAKFRGSAQLTQIGTTVGTAAYMSPEQAKGDDVDQRTDIWSFGIVLHELLTGRMPFKGDYEQAVLYAVLNEEPQPFEGFPQPLVDIVMKCLQKNPQDRYADCTALLADLTQLGQAGSHPSTASHTSVPQKLEKSKRLKIWIGIASVLVISLLTILFLVNRQQQKITSLAILPFTNSGGSEDTEYLSDGIPESIISYLQKIPDLKIISFNAVLRQYKEDVPDPRTVGEEMDVQSVAMGRISLRGDDISINIEIIDTRDNTVIMTQQFMEKLSALYEIQSKVGKEITQKLQLEMSDNILVQKAPDPLAYQNYLKGRIYWYRRTAKDLKQAEDYFKKAIEIDPEFAPAYTGLSDTYKLQNDYAGIADHIALPKALDAALKALQLDSNLAEAHTSLAGYYQDNGKYSKAQKEYEKAIRLNPGYLQAYQWLGSNYRAKSYYNEAEKIWNKALELDPHSPMICCNLASNYALRGDSVKAFKLIKETVEQNPDFTIAFFTYAEILIRYKRYEEAIKMGLKGLATEEGSAYSYQRMGGIYLGARIYDKAIEQFTKMAEVDANFTYRKHYFIGQVHVAQKDWQQAYNHFKNAKDIDPYNDQVYWRLADYYWHNYDYEPLVGLYEKIARLDEYNPDANNNAALINELFADQNMALNYMLKAVDSDSSMAVNLGLLYIHRDQLDKGISLSEPFKDLNAQIVLCYAFLIKNSFQEAVTAFDKALKTQNFKKRTIIYNRIFGNGNFNRENVQTYLKNVFNEIDEANILNWWIYRSLIYSAVGEVDSAFVYINKGLESTTLIWAYYLILRSPAMEKFKNDPRYHALIKRLKLEDYL